MSQVADPEVSRRKFDRELAHLRSNEDLLVARGWWILKAEFPLVKIAIAAVKMKPAVIPFAVQVDFTDYDVRPLSLKFVAPFEDRELLPGEMVTKLPRSMPLPEGVIMAGDGNVGGPRVELYQHYPQLPMMPGFLCLPGVREYHDHPAHTGDPWELHRSVGEGRLFTLLETVWRYGADPLNQIGFQFNMTYSQTEFPA